MINHLNTNDSYFIEKSSVYSYKDKHIIALKKAMNDYKITYKRAKKNKNNPDEAIRVLEDCKDRLLDIRTEVENIPVDIGAESWYSISKMLHSGLNGYNIGTLVFFAALTGSLVKQFKNDEAYEQNFKRRFPEDEVPQDKKIRLLDKFNEFSKGLENSLPNLKKTSYKTAAIGAGIGAGVASASIISTVIKSKNPAVMKARIIKDIDKEIKKCEQLIKKIER